MSPYNPAGRTKVARLGADLDNLIARFEAVIRDPHSPLELGADMAKYACVRVCGYLEQAVATMAIAHVDARSAPTVARFSASWLSRSQNPKRGVLIEFANRFDPTWGSELAALFEDIDPNGSFDSLVQLRNDIAHGLPSSLGRDSLLRYLDLTKTVVTWFRDKLDPRPLGGAHP